MSLGIFCALPFAAAWGMPMEGRAGISAVLAATVLFAWRRVSSRTLGYFEGLNVIASAFVSTSDDLTAVYIAPVILLMHLGASWIAVSSLGRGAGNSRKRWAAFVRSLYCRVHRVTPVEFEAKVRELRAPPEVLEWIPESERPWHQRYLLLYRPRESRTALYHAGFYCSVLLGIAFLASARALADATQGSYDLLYGLALWLFIGVYCYRIARLRDRVLPGQ
jgi:hypothetical protein